MRREVAGFVPLIGLDFEQSRDDEHAWPLLAQLLLGQLDQRIEKLSNLLPRQLGGLGEMLHDGRLGHCLVRTHRTVTSNAGTARWSSAYARLLAPGVASVPPDPSGPTPSATA